uniref:Uncharacterized protein n=1 Tax=Arundo donax TaxID=35708 RepID=A0A0A8YC26_ARUDO
MLLPSCSYTNLESSTAFSKVGYVLASLNAYLYALLFEN